jgi:hypothetical protein
MITSHWRKLLAQLMTPKDWVATFIAVLALVTSVWSGIATRTYTVLSARPHLKVATLFASSSPRLGSELFNLGPGVAIIDEFNLSLDGTPLTGDWVEQWQQIRKKTGAEDWTNIGGFQKGDVLPANPSAPADILIIVDESQFSQKDPVEWRRRGLLMDVVNRVTVKIRYHSVYGEFFESENQGQKPTRYCRRNWLGRYVEWQP